MVCAFKDNMLLFNMHIIFTRLIVSVRMLHKQAASNMFCGVLRIPPGFKISACCCSFKQVVVNILKSMEITECNI